MLWMRKKERAFVGFVSAAYSCPFNELSWSGSHMAQEEALVVAPVPPKYCARHQLGTPSPRVSTEVATMRLVWGLVLEPPAPLAVRRTVLVPGSR